MMHDVTQKHHDDSGQKHDRRDCLEDNEGRAKESVAETATEGVGEGGGSRSRRSKKHWCNRDNNHFRITSVTLQGTAEDV